VSTTKNILVLTGWSFKDALVQVYTLPYVRLIKKTLPPGYRVILVTMEQPASRLPAEEARQAASTLEEEGITWMPLHYKKFGPAGLLQWSFHLLKLFFVLRSRNVSCIHAWCTPAGSLGYLLSRLTGVPLVIDSYEPHAEAMVENGTWQKDSLAFRLLFHFEKKLTRHARAVIAATAAMRNYAREKYGTVPAYFYVKAACVDAEYFSKFKKKDPTLLKELGLESKVVCIYAGKFGGIYLTGEVFDFFKTANDYWGSSFKVLLLTNHPVEEIKSLAAASGLDWNDLVLRFVKPAEIPVYIGLADFAITPVKPVPTKRYCTPIKDGEYWAMGLPVVITRNISDDSELIENHNAGYVLQNLTQASYRAAVEKIDSMFKGDMQETERRIRSLAYDHRNFSDAEKIYRELYGSVIRLQAPLQP
jgi:glycosyltransferase involved in cell wall biosynthesis